MLDTPTPASTAPFQVTVASSAGTASVGNPANVTVTGDGTNSLQFQGSIADITAALGGLVYTNATARGAGFEAGMIGSSLSYLGIAGRNAKGFSGRKLPDASPL